MANFLYNTNIRLYGLAAKLAANFNAKARLFTQGRKTVWKQLESFKKPNVVWFHAASLGEFEQGKPVMEQLKKDHPEINLVVSFFSPSGYEERKDWPLATTCYLPLDTPENARRFIATINPMLAVFIRYEFWANYLDELHAQRIPTAVIAAQFRPGQFAFKPLGKFLLNRIARLDAILVQYASAKVLLVQHGFEKSKISICGDSRFDRVLETLNQAEAIPEIEWFKGHSPVVILGSCYQKEEAFVAPLYNAFPNWKFIYAPHLVDEENIKKLLSRLPGPGTRLTQFAQNDNRILVLDTIGKLAAAYQYGDMAVVGGGFRDGIHNILEPAAFGLPVFFGPNHQAFPEAQALIDAQLAFEIDDHGHAASTLKTLMTNEELRHFHQQNMQGFVKKHAGATKCISKKIEGLITLS